VVGSSAGFVQCRHCLTYFSYIHMIRRRTRSRPRFWWIHRPGGRREEAGAKRRRPTPTLRRVRKQPHPGMHAHCSALSPEKIVIFLSDLGDFPGCIHDYVVVVPFVESSWINSRANLVLRASSMVK
jgi:hypothetical protein